jgi:hypothetical protein
MNCMEFERQWQELDDPSLFSPGMEEHVRSCAGCAGLVREVNLLRWEARQLVETEQPPDRVWSNIRSELSREGVLREPGARSWLTSVLAFGWLPRLPMGVAYASVFFLALVGVEYVRDQVTPPSPIPAVASAPLAPSADVASEQVAASIAAPAPARDEEVVQRAEQRVIEKAPPERRAVFVRNLQQLDSSVGELQRFLNEHPDDPLALEQLFIMQQQRTRFVGTFVRMEE